MTPKEPPVIGPALPSGEPPKRSPGLSSRAEGLRISGRRPRKPNRPSVTCPIDHPEFDDHEEVLSFFDSDSGLSAIIAVHSTARGPAIGGCRMKPYATTKDALFDVLRLSKGMSFKCAMINLPMGGAKSVIIGDHKTQKTPQLLKAFAERVERMGGSYIVAEDANITTNDVAIMAGRTKSVVGLDVGYAPSGNPAPVTARGVSLGIEVSIAEKLGGGLKGRRIAVLGVGDVGSRVAELVSAAGAKVTVADVDTARATAVASSIGGEAVSIEDLWNTETDVFCPCALGASISVRRAEQVNAPIVAGAENNQLAGSEAGDVLYAREILYAPDYVINAGGLINCYAEVVAIQHKLPFKAAWVEAKLADIGANLREVFALAKASKRPTHRVADEEARRRIGRA